MSLDGRNAIVTGGASGIGRAISKKLAAGGANVIVADVNKEPKLGSKSTVQSINEDGGEAVFIKTNVSDEKSVRDMVFNAASQYGSIDILVNNAGIHAGGSIHETEEEKWDRIQEVNLKGVYLCSKYVVEHMLEENIEGDIVNIGSIAGLVGFSENSPYCASKGGVVELTRSMAVDYGPEGINVNAVDPGVIKTSMTIDMLENEEQREFFENKTLTKRLGRPSDIANAVEFLVSSKSDFITGENLVVDGGWTSK